MLVSACLIKWGFMLSAHNRSLHRANYNCNVVLSFIYSFVHGFWGCQEVRQES